MMPLNDEWYATRPILIDLNSLELKYYPLMSSLDKWRGSCNAVNDLYTKYVFPVKKAT